MKCWHCNTELIWGGDHDMECDDGEFSTFAIVTNLSCPGCGSYVEVYLPTHATWKAEEEAEV